VNTQSAKTRGRATIDCVSNDLRSRCCVRRNEGAGIQPMVDRWSLIDRNRLRCNRRDVRLRGADAAKSAAARWVRLTSPAWALAGARPAAGHATVLLDGATRSAGRLRLVTGASRCATHTGTWRHRRLKCGEKCGGQDNGGASSLHAGKLYHWAVINGISLKQRLHRTSHGRRVLSVCC
jgi:hypothetical protein